MKTLKERTDLDLLTLVCELHARSCNYMTKELHDASAEARQELESRIIAYQNHDKVHISNRREQLIAFLREQNKLHYVTIYENDFEFADKLLKAINCR